MDGLKYLEKERERLRDCTTYRTSLKRVISSIYKKLNGEEMPTSPSQNPMFLKNVSYSDRRYRDAIIKMNEFIRQQRHLSPE